MKKILAILSSLSLVTTSALTAIACHTNDEEQLSSEKKKVLAAVQEIVDEGVEYNDKDLSVSIFARLLSSLIKDKINIKLGAGYLNQYFPNFALNIFFPNHWKDARGKRKKILLGEEVEYEYCVLINFNVFDDINVFGTVTKRLDDDSIPSYKRIPQTVDDSIVFTSLDRYGEHIIWRKQKTDQWPTFKFKQGRYLETVQEKLDFYFDGYINFSFGKLFNSDPDIASFSLIPKLIMREKDAEKFNIPLNLIHLLKENPHLGFGAEIGNFLKEYFEDEKIISNIEGRFKYNFITDLIVNSSKFVEAYDMYEILGNSKLFTAFGDPTIINKGGYTKAVLVYDLDFSLANNEIISKNSHKERVYISIYFDEFTSENNGV